MKVSYSMLGPFITKAVFRQRDGRQKVWLSRVYRKGLPFGKLPHDLLAGPFWKSQAYNNSIGWIFVIGASLFALASAMMFLRHPSPELIQIANIIFFAGSVPFTIAATLQHIQSANDPGFTHDISAPETKTRFKLIGWTPRSAGWWSTATQLAGTIAFNISTYSAISPPDSQPLEHLLVWEQNVEGSVLFLISGYLAFIEVAHKYWSWMPRDLSWRVVFVNLLGCIAFMIAAVAPASLGDNGLMAYVSYGNSYTFLGAIFFCIGALLSLKESKG